MSIAKAHGHKSQTANLACSVFMQAYQLFKARAYGADAVLLIAAVLPNNDLEYLIAAGRKLGLQSLVEVRLLLVVCTCKLMLERCKHSEVHAHALSYHARPGAMSHALCVVYCTGCTPSMCSSNAQSVQYQKASQNR